jgi:hypothetical protein
MYFTFSEEPSYGIDATTQDFVVDLVSEEVITNLNYDKVDQFNYPTSQSRIPRIKTTQGRVQFDLTYGNLAWNSLFKTLIGQSVILTDFAFAKSSESWNIVTGMLANDLDSSSTSFTITEYKTGEFNNVNGIIIGGEYVAVTGISNGAVTASSRASEGTLAASHSQHTLCYGVVSDASRKIEIISRYRSGFCYYLPTSLTTMIYREGDYFEFNGCQFSDFVFTADMNSIEASFELVGKNTRVINIASPSTSVDNGVMVSPLDINCYCMNQELKIQKLYMQVSNTLIHSSSKFFDTTCEKILMSSHSEYGQFTLDDESIAAYNSYIADEIKNLSVTMCESKQFEKAYVFSFNKIRYGTMLHVLYGSIDLKGDSIPIYTYDPDGFFLLIQT